MTAPGETLVIVPSRCPTASETGQAAAAAGCWTAGGGGPVILISSAQVNEPSHFHSGLLSENRLRRPKMGNTIARDWLRLEQRFAEVLAEGQSTLTILRPTAVPLPDGQDIFSRLLRGSWATVPPGFNPPLQLLHLDDLAQAILRAACVTREGSFNVAPTSVIPLRQAIRHSGQRRLPLPGFLHRRGGSLERPPLADELAYLSHPWTVSDRSIRHRLRFEPRHSSAETIQWLRRAKSARSRHPPPLASATAASAAEDGYDPFGMDRGYIDRLGRTLFRFLHDRYWRIEWRGLEHVPRQGRAVLVGIHRGLQPWDGVMILHFLARELGRYPRFLIHPALVKHPFLAPYMTQIGGLLACRENGAWVLEREKILGIFPEGIRGAFTRYRDAYRLGNFGRHDFVKMALRHRAPIVPLVTVGSAEIFPILGKIRWRWWQRFSGWPCFPVTPTLSLLPLPSKWHTLILPPLAVHEEFPPQAADDPEIVTRISHQVQTQLQAALDDLRSRRKSIFWGSIFPRDES